MNDSCLLLKYRIAFAALTELRDNPIAQKALQRCIDIDDCCPNCEYPGKIHHTETGDGWICPCCGFNSYHQDKTDTAKDTMEGWKS